MRARLVLRIATFLSVLGMLLSASVGLAGAQVAGPTPGSVVGLQEGDILLMRNAKDLWGKYSYWTHNAIYVGRYPADLSKPATCDNAIVEAILWKVTVTCLTNPNHWWNRADYGRSVVRVKASLDPTGSKGKAAAAWARGKVGVSYDLAWSRTSSALYCSELVWKAYQSVGLNVEYYRSGRWPDYITPDDNRFDNDVELKAEVCLGTCPMTVLKRL